MEQVNRTIEYEKHLERIENLRKQAIDARSAARAFGDYAEILRNLPTLGAVADHARQMIIDFCNESADGCRNLIKDNNMLADELETKGLREE